MATGATSGTPGPTSLFLGRPPFVRLDSTLLRRALRTGVCVASWGVLTLFVLFTAYLVWLVLLALALLGQGPSSSDVMPVLVPLFSAITLTIAVLVARYVSSLRRVSAVVAVMLALAWGAALTWGLASPHWALYLARAVAWGESDVKDYQKFPQRQIATGPAVYNFPRSQAPLGLQTVEYKSGGQTRQVDIETLLKSTNTTSFIVIKDGQIRYEGYFNGYSRDSVVTSFSVAKSFMSALAGIAIDEGYIGSVDDKITAYLPELRGKGFDDVTIRHLLTMSSGVRYITDDEASVLRFLTISSDQTIAYYHPDLRSRALVVKPDGRAAGARFKYNDYLPQLLGIILERTTHRPVSQYLQEKIWQPLGMEFPASWSLGSMESGFEQMQSGINARAIDFAKFGQLFLGNGAWNSKQIVPASRVKQSTAPDPNDTRPWDTDKEWQDAGGYYKYFWWGMPNADGSYDFVARGHLGQRIYVSPRYNTVIVRFGPNEGGVDRWEDVFAGISASLR